MEDRRGDRREDNGERSMEDRREDDGERRMENRREDRWEDRRGEKLRGKFSKKIKNRDHTTSHNMHGENNTMYDNGINIKNMS